MQQEALRKVDPDLAQPLQHRRLVDELGHGLDAHHLRHVCKTPNRCLVQRVVDHVAHELPVDFQEVDAQVLQVPERRRPRPEVVKGHRDTHRPDLVDEHGCIGDVGHGCGFRDLKAQRFADARAGLGEQVQRPSVERAVTDRLPGQVDAEQCNLCLGRQGFHPVRHAFEHPAVDPRRQVETLGCRQEGTRQHHRSIAVLHPQQHLGVQARRLAAQRLDPLGEQREAVFVQRGLDAGGPLRLELPFVHGAVGVEPGVYAVPPGFLGRVARGIGRLLDRHRRGPAFVHRHQTDAGADAKAPLLMDEPEVVHAVADLLRHALSLIGRAVLHDDGELVAAEPCQGVAMADGFAQQLGHLLQKLVADRMPAGVVDEFELVEVDVQQRVMAVVLMRLLQHAQQPGFELGPVDQPGHGVVGGAVAHFAREPSLLAHVVEHQHHAEHVAPLVANRRGGVFDPVFTAVACQQQGVVGQADDLALLQAACDRVGRGLAAGLVDDVKHLHQRPALGLVREPAGQSFGDRVQPGDAPAGVGRDDRVADGRQCHAQQRAFFGQLGGQAPLFGDVPVGAGQAQHPAAGIAGDASRAAQVMHAAIGPDHAKLGIEGLAPAHGGPHGLLRGRQVVGVYTAPPQLGWGRAAVFRIAEQAVHPGVPERRLAVEVPVPDADAAAVGGQRHALVGFLQRMLPRDAFAHVLKGAEHPHRLAVREFNRADGAHPDALAIGANERQLQVARLAGGHARLDGRLDHRAGFGRKELDGALQNRLVPRLHANNSAGLIGPDDLLGDEIEFPAADTGELAGAVQEQLAFAQRSFLSLALGDVERNRVVALSLASGIQIRNQALLRPVLAPLNAGMNLELPRLAPHGSVLVVLDLGVESLAPKLSRCSADVAGGVDSEDASKVFIDEGAAMVDIEPGNDGRHVVGDGAQMAFGLLQLRLVVAQRLSQGCAQFQFATDQHEPAGEHGEQNRQRRTAQAHGGVPRLAGRCRARDELCLLVSHHFSADGAYLVHQSLAFVAADNRQRGFGALRVQGNGLRKLGQLLRHQRPQVFEARLLSRVVADPSFHLDEVELHRRQAASIGVEVAVLRGQQVAARAGFGVEHSACHSFDRVQRVARVVRQHRGLVELVELPVRHGGQPRKHHQAGQQQGTHDLFQCETSQAVTVWHRVGCSLSARRRRIACGP